MSVDPPHYRDLEKLIADNRERIAMLEYRERLRERLEHE